MIAAILATLLLPLAAVGVLAYLDLLLIQDVRDVPTFTEPVVSQRAEWAADFAAVRATLACDRYLAGRVHNRLYATGRELAA